jgi:hypothetical protein
MVAGFRDSTSTFANERQRVQMGLVMLFSAFTGSRPGTLLPDDDSSCRDSRESSAGDSSMYGPLTKYGS